MNVGSIVTGSPSAIPVQQGLPRKQGLAMLVQMTVPRVGLLWTSLEKFLPNVEHATKGSLSTKINASNVISRTVMLARS